MPPSEAITISSFHLRLHITANTEQIRQRISLVILPIRNCNSLLCVAESSCVLLNAVADPKVKLPLSFEGGGVRERR